MSDINQFYERLRNEIVTVTFTKVDGTERTMRVTLREDILPPKTEKKTERKRPEGLVSAWSVDDAGWRSFRFDSIIQ